MDSKDNYSAYSSLVESQLLESPKSDAPVTKRQRIRANSFPGTNTYDNSLVQKNTHDIANDQGEGFGTGYSETQGSTAGNVPSLSDLGEDLLLLILQAAQPTAWDLCRFACVNKTWKKLSYSQMFWTKLRVGSGSMRKGVEQLASRCYNLAEIHIEDPRCELHILHPIIVAGADSLRRVVINCDKEDTSRNEASICSILWIFSLYCKNVETIELASDGREGSYGYLENKALWYLTTGFRHVRNFSCLCRNSVSKQAIYLLVIAWRELTCLRIHVGALTWEDLMALRKCYSLRLLELVGGQAGLIAPAESDTVLHRDLEVLVLSEMRCEPSEVALLAEMCPKLRRLILRKSSIYFGSSIESAWRYHTYKRMQTWFASRNVELVLEQ